jgi:hypothetical protein
MITVTSNGKNGTGFVTTPGQSNQATASAYIQPISAPAPTISFGNMDVTNQSCDPNGTPAQAALCVVVGQDITLTASVNLPAGVAVSSQSWAISSGTAVGGYAASATPCTGVSPLYSCGGSWMPLNTTGPNFTFYWVDANAVGTGATRQVTYTYWLNNDPNNSAATAVTFTVTGPTGVSIAAVPTPEQFPTILPGMIPQLAYQGSSTPGISFTASAVPPAATNGRFWWIQLATANTLSVFDSNGLEQLTAFSSNANEAELDTTYPYVNTTSTFLSQIPQSIATDSPAAYLPSCTGGVKQTLSATMYLLWNPTLPLGCTPGVIGVDCTSIPVPLGSVSWSYCGAAVNTLDPSQGTQGWIQGCTPLDVRVPTFQPSNPANDVNYSYPVWKVTTRKVPFPCS